MQIFSEITQVNTAIKTVAHREKLIDLRKLRKVLNDMNYFINVDRRFYIAFADGDAHATHDAVLFKSWLKDHERGKWTRLVSVVYANNSYIIDFI